MELLGREKELAAATAAIAAVGEGAPRALAVMGEAGIGKSALLLAVQERAGGAGLLVLSGRAAEHERDVPFGLVVDALDDHVAAMHHRRVETVGPELAAVLPSAAVMVDGDAPAAAPGDPAERFRYHRALRSLLAMMAREKPVALLLDDLHWADEASVELVLHLLRRPPAGPVLLAFAMRPVDPARRLLDAVRTGPSAELVAVEPLDHDASLALAGDIADPALRDRVARDARGNPLFVQELARAARDPAGPLPETLLAAIQLEVDALPPASRTLIDGAAVAGDPFDPELAAAAAALDPADALAPLDRLVAADLVRPGVDARAFRFRHPLVMRAVYDGAPPAWRLGAHERVAAVLAARGAAPGVRAYHVEQYARPGDEGAIALLGEAAAAAAATAPATAARWYGAAVRLLPDGDVERRGGLLAAQAVALADAGRLEEGREALIEVLGLLPPGPSPFKPGLIAGLVQLEQLLGRHADANRRLAAALDEAPPQERATLETQQAIGCAFASDARGMRESAARALAGAPGDAALVVTATALSGLGAQWEADRAASDAALEAAEAGYARLSDEALAGRLDTALWLGWGQMLTERFAGAERTLRRSVDLAERLGQARLLSILTALRSLNLTNSLELDQALRMSETGEERARLAGQHSPLFWALWSRVLVKRMAGEQAEAERAAAEALDLVPRLEPDRGVLAGMCNFGALHVEADPERCVREMTAAAGTLLENADTTWSTWLLRQLVLAHLALGRIDDAERCALRSVEHAAAFGLPVGACRAATAHAEVLTARGEPDRAVALALDAVAATERMEAARDAVESRLTAGRALAAAGRREDAVAAFQRAAADAGRAGAMLFHDSAARELRRLGSRISAETRRAARGTAELTERERDIAGLVAAGKSNKEVAASLFLSEKTIEHHLSRIYAKLGVRSRVELAGAAWETA
ncbi:MAG TPA: AAA family ATPase [Solirubrobacteraceae bacterium]|nr:AAA family ATPase [Solirubrobacteraceae bacterium]